jgi:hypothetical protein
MRTREEIERSYGNVNVPNNGNQQILEVLLDIRDILEKINTEKLYQRRD